MVESDYWANQSAQAIFGPGYVTVGNVGSGAKYQSGDQTAFNAAIQALVALGGGELYVLPGTTIKPTASLLITGSNIRVTFGRNAIVSVVTQFGTPIFSGGAASWTQVVVVGGTAGAPAQHIDIVDMTLTQSAYNPNTDLISGIVIAGNVYDLDVWHLRTTYFGRYGAWVTGYAEAPLGTPYSGPFYGITFWGHSSDFIGESNGSDGAHLKISYTGTTGTVGGVHSWDDYATNLYAIGIDLPVVSGASAVIARDIQIHGAHLEAQAANQPGIFLESQDSAAGVGDAYDFLIEGCWVSGFTINYAIDATVHHVRITDCTSLGASTIGLTGSATLYASRVSLAPQDWYISNFISRQDPTALRFVSSGLLTGLSMEGISVRGGSSNDEGSTLNTVGISVTASATKLIKDLEVRDFNLANIAGGGTAVSIASGTAPYLTNAAFRSCPGFGGQGYSLSAGSEPIIVAQTFQKAETNAADANVLTYTPPAVAGTYVVDYSVDVASATSGVIKPNLSYTDSNGLAVGAAQTFGGFQMGTAAPNLTFTTSVAGNYTWRWVCGVGAGAVAIIAKWAGGGTSAAKVTVVVTQIA